MEAAEFSRNLKVSKNIYHNNKDNVSKTNKYSTCGPSRNYSARKCSNIIIKSNFSQLNPIFCRSPFPSVGKYQATSSLTPVPPFLLPKKLYKISFKYDNMVFIAA